MWSGAQVRTPLSTPLDKVERLLERYRGEPASKCRCVLLSTGSYNPIHRMHVESFYLARRALEERNLLVVGAFLSPSHDSYVRSKLGDHDCIGTEDRLNMCQLSIDAQQGQDVGSQPFLSLDAWESSSCSHPIDHNKVTLSLREYLAQHFPNESIRVVYLCGSDHFTRCRYMVWLRQQTNVSVAMVKRPSHLKNNAHNDGGFSQDSETFEDVYVIETSREEDCSSTLIRQRAQAGETISDLVFPQVEEYMRKNGIYYTAMTNPHRRACVVQ